MDFEEKNKGSFVGAFMEEDLNKQKEQDEKPSVITNGRTAYLQELENIKGMIKNLKGIINEQFFLNKINEIEVQLQKDLDALPESFDFFSRDMNSYTHYNYQKKLQEIQTELEFYEPMFTLKTMMEKINRLLIDYETDKKIYPEIMSLSEQFIKYYSSTIDRVNASFNKEYSLEDFNKAYDFCLNECNNFLFKVLLFSCSIKNPNLVDLLKRIDNAYIREKVGRIVDEAALENDIMLDRQKMDDDMLDFDSLTSISKKVAYFDESDEYLIKKRELEKEREIARDLIDKSKKNILGNNIKLTYLSPLFLSLKARLVPIVLVPVIAFSLGHSKGVERSNKVNLYNTHTVVTNLTTGEEEVRFSEYTEQTASYITSITITEEWKVSPAKDGCIRKCHTYTFDNPIEVSEIYTLDDYLELLNSNVPQISEYVEYGSLDKLNNNQNEVLISEMHSDLNDSIKSKKYVAHDTLIGGSIGMVLLALLFVLYGVSKDVVNDYTDTIEDTIKKLIEENKKAKFEIKDANKTLKR